MKRTAALFLVLSLCPAPGSLPAGQAGAAESFSAPAMGLSAAAAPAPPRIETIVIDAGHGGKDPGAMRPNGLREKRVALEIARKVKAELQARGLEVLMTRDSDDFVALADRAKLANERRADFFVSIHANASEASSLKGFEVYYLSEATDDNALAVERAENSSLRFEGPAKRSKTLDTIFWDLRETENRRESLRLARKVAAAVGGLVDVAARRVKSANFYVLKWTECPAVLIELGYITNDEDRKRLHEPSYKTALAHAIVEGIWRHKEEYERTNGFTR